MKKSNWLTLGLGILVLGLLFFWLIFSWIIPGTAQLGLPGKWRNLPAGQNRWVVHDYLGVPIRKSNQNDTSFEEWLSGDKKHLYRLKMEYGKDTVATNYAIHYHFSNWLVSRDYLIDSFSIR